MSSGSLQLTAGSESGAAGELKSCQTHGGKSALGGNGSRDVRALRCGMCWRLCAEGWEWPESSGGGRGGFSFLQCARWKCSPEQLEGCFGSKMEHFHSCSLFNSKHQSQPKRIWTLVSPVAVIGVFLLAARRRGVGISDLSSGGFRLLVGKAEIKIGI